MEIVEVNGMNIKVYLEQKVIFYIFFLIDYILWDLVVFCMFQVFKGISFEVKFKLFIGKIKLLSLIYFEIIEKEVYLVFEFWQLMEFKWINEDIVYVLFNLFGNFKIDFLFIEKLFEFYKVKKFIVDLCKNGGGNMLIGREILEYFMIDLVFYGLKMCSRLYILFFKVWGIWILV